MIDQLIEFKTAKLAKEKGFNLLCTHFYNTDNPHSLDKELTKQGGLYQDNLGDVWCDGRIDEESGLEEYKLISANQAPTQSLLQKWLREKHDIDIIIDREGAIQTQRIGFSASVYTIKTAIIFGPLKTIYDTYEEALEVGLKEGLKLIKYEKSNN